MEFDKWLLEFKSKGIGNPLMSECYEAGLQQNKSELIRLQRRIDDLERWIINNKKHIPMSEWHGYTDEEYVDADDLIDLLRGVNE